MSNALVCVRSLLWRTYNRNTCSIVTPSKASAKGPLFSHCWPTGSLSALEPARGSDRGGGERAPPPPAARRSRRIRLFTRRPGEGDAGRARGSSALLGGRGHLGVTVLDAAYPVNLRMVHDRPPVLFVRGTPRRERRAIRRGRRHAQARPTEGIEQATASCPLRGRRRLRRGQRPGRWHRHRGATVQRWRRAVGRSPSSGQACERSSRRRTPICRSGSRHDSAVVSQFWPGQEARKWTFPQRNAVMSGFARATVVVEASHTSGARMQARLALEHGRPVFLLRSLLEHKWARTYAEDRPGTYVVDERQRDRRAPRPSLLDRSRFWRRAPRS